MKKTVILLLAITSYALGKAEIEYFPYGQFESWTVRYIKESLLLGGNTRTLYAIGPTDTIRQNAPLAYGRGGSLWSSSNAYAKVVGVEKAANSVRPDRHKGGYCCRMETTMQSISAVGIELKALATGSIFLGQLQDPVTIEGTRNPVAAIDMGIPFTRCPKALIFDYKAHIENSTQLWYANACRKPSPRTGHDQGEVILILQRRWEDANGNIYAERVATAHMRITKSTDWQEAVQLPLLYGAPTPQNALHASAGLSRTRFMARNSKGKMVYINELRYASTDARPTHLILQMSSGCQEPFVGHPGNVLWCDNVGLVY